MKTLSTLAIVAFASSTAFAGTCDQPTMPAYPGFAQAMPTTGFMPANYEPAYIGELRAEMEQRGAAMRDEIAKRMSEARAQVEDYATDARSQLSVPEFARPDFAATAPDFGQPLDPAKFIEEQRAAAEKMIADMRNNVPAMPQFQGPQVAAPTYPAPQFQAPATAFDPAEAQKAWQEQQAAAMKAFEEQRKAYEDQAKTAAAQWQEQMQAQQQAMAVQQAEAAKRWEEARQQYAQAPATAYPVAAPTFGPMNQDAFMEQMEAQRAAAEKMMREAQERMQQQIQCRTI